MIVSLENIKSGYDSTYFDCSDSFYNFAQNLSAARKSLRYAQVYVSHGTFLDNKLIEIMDMLDDIEVEKD
jgi:hypothetical protein